MQPHLLVFGAVKVPTTNAVIASEHVHGCHADGQSHSGDNHLPGMRGHKQAMESEKSAQHFGLKVGQQLDRKGVKKNGKGGVNKKLVRQDFSDGRIVNMLVSRTIRMSNKINNTGIDYNIFVQIDHD